MKVDTKAESKWIASHRLISIITSLTLDFVYVTMKLLLFTKAYSAHFFKRFNVTTNLKVERNINSEFIRVVYPVNFSGISLREQVNIQ